MIEKSKENQLLKAYITKHNDMQGVIKTNSGRHCYHIRFKLSGSLTDYQKYFKPLNIMVKESDHSCSSKSPTYILENTVQIDSIPKNTQLYWVNNEVENSKTGSTLFATKDLSPDKLNVTAKTYTIDELIADVTKKVQLKYDKCVATELIRLLNLASQKKDIIKIDPILTFTTEDLKVISKDFGEILAAIWIMKNSNFSKVIFPKNSNEKLIDFYAEKVSINYPISVKSGKGGKVLLQNLIDALNRRTRKHSKKISEEPIYQIIQIVNKNSAKEQMVIIHQYLQTKMIEDLATILKKPIELIDLEYIKNWSNSKTIEELKELLSDWWKEYSQPTKFNIQDQERLVISPLGEAIKYTLNNDPKLKESLNCIAKQVALLQVNVDINTKTMRFQKSFFKNAKFEFGWPGYSSGNKLGFRMV
ncbi:hypothetical protein [Sulfurimonas marina]|uniref:Uncharacterized protein n=1 Tax=Sulfurimonas marina TaxID=2590551 RepID=A0A7M1AWL6_9BACT|nr:hypothetical protein [Sulfurimonas marina]QOP41815.1 hypothetical protein FJR03_08740 [Sulfurimonas marina]